MNLQKSLFILPNLFTLSSVFCGVYAALLCAGQPTQEGFRLICLLIVFAALFDTLDGRVARLTHTQSAFGVQLDSLADMVSFGVAPAMLMYQWSLHQLGLVGVIGAFAFAACGAIRLARFNVLAMSADPKKKPSKYVVGLPIPGAAAVLVSLVLANQTINAHVEGNPQLILGTVSVLSFFMVSTILFRSFKDLRFDVRTLVTASVAVGLVVTVAFRFHFYVAALMALSGYLLFGVLESGLTLLRRGMASRRLEADDDEELRET